MKKIFFVKISAFLILTLIGCGSDKNNDGPPIFVTEILSAAKFDGDIQLNSFSNTLTIAQGDTESVFAGIDPINGDEYRAFLLFPLASVPLNAKIESAFLDIFINNVDIQFPNDTIPMRIELVSFQPPFLIESDFYRQAHLGIPPVTFPMFLADLRNYVTIDVTSLMIAAQNSQLTDFQVRIMEDFETDIPGLIEINDTINLANRNTFAPLLTVNYF